MNKLKKLGLIGLITALGFLGCTSISRKPSIISRSRTTYSKSESKEKPELLEKKVEEKSTKNLDYINLHHDRWIDYFEKSKYVFNFTLLELRTLYTGAYEDMPVFFRNWS